MKLCHRFKVKNCCEIFFSITLFLKKLQNKTSAPLPNETEPATKLSYTSPQISDILLNSFIFNNIWALRLKNFTLNEQHENVVLKTFT